MSEGKAVVDATVFVRFPDGGSIAAPTDANGRHPLFFSQNAEPVPITVSKPGFATLSRNVAPADFGPARELELELERTEPPSSLRLEFTAAKGAPLGSADLELALVGTEWTIQRRLAPGASTLDIAELPAGAYELRCTPRIDASLPPESQARWSSTTLELECRPSEAERVPVALHPAGSVAFHLKGFDPADTEAWSIHGPDPDLRTHFLAWRGVPPTLEELYIPTELPGDTTIWLRQALVPGDYTLDLRHAGEPHAFPFSVIAGAFTDVHLAFN